VRSSACQARPGGSWRSDSDGNGTISLEPALGKYLGPSDERLLWTVNVGGAGSRERRSIHLHGGAHSLARLRLTSTALGAADAVGTRTVEGVVTARARTTPAAQSVEVEHELRIRCVSTVVAW
jgi:hypothetical protein